MEQVLQEVQGQILVREETLAAYDWCYNIMVVGFEDEQPASVLAGPPLGGLGALLQPQIPAQPDPMVGILRNEVTALQGQVSQLIRDLQPLRQLLQGPR